MAAPCTPSNQCEAFLTFLEEERPGALIGSFSLLPLELQLSLSLLLSALPRSLLVVLQEIGHTFTTWRRMQDAAG